MKKIAVIGASEFQDPLILKAKEMGFETHVFAWRSGDIGERTADFFYPISITEKEAILDKCREIGICAIVSIASDLAVHTVNYVSRAMGFICNSERCELVSTDKYRMRSAFAEAGIPVPRFVLVDGGFDKSALEDFHYPLIVKPTDRSGSRGITKIDNETQLDAAIAAAKEQSFSNTAIVEEFIYGNEYSCECISFDGKHETLALTKKFTTGAPHFIECGHAQPSDIPIRFIPNIRNTIFSALDALDIRYGASHPEFRITPDGNIYIIEIGARMGGDFIGSDLVRISTGYDFMRMVIDAACGIKPDISPVSEAKRAYVRFIFNDSDLREMERIRKEYPSSIWRCSDSVRLGDHEILDSSKRFGYYIRAIPYDE